MIIFDSLKVISEKPQVNQAVPYSGHLITTLYGVIGIQVAQGVPVEYQDQVDLYVLLVHAQISGLLVNSQANSIINMAA